MGRIVNWANGIRHSGARLGPSDIVMAGLDYKQGKDEGEDDFRAAGGAAASTAGGWGGAIAGGATGAAIGSAVPIVGTAVGGAIGAVIGGMGGSSAGGWAFDRADEMVRGKSDSKNNNVVPAVAGTVAAGVVGNKLLKSRGDNMVNPYQTYKAMRLGGAGIGESASVAARSGGQQLAPIAGKVLTHLATKVGAGIGGGYVLNNVFGNPIGGLVDAATGGLTNFKPNEDDEWGRAHQARLVQEQIKASGYDPDINATDAQKTLSDYDEFFKFAREAQDPFGYQQTATRAADEQTNQLMENRGYRVGNYLLNNDMIKGSFENQNNMAAKAIDGYWQNRAANNQTIAGMFRR